MAQRKQQSGGNPWRAVFMAALQKIQSLRAPDTSARSGATAAATGVSALVPVDVSKIIKKSIQKNQKAEKEILTVSEALNQYRTRDAQEFEKWRRETFARENEQIEKLKESLRAAAQEIEELERAALPRGRGRDEPNFAFSEDSQGEADLGDDWDDEEAASHESEHRTRPEDACLSEEGWIFMNVCMDLMESLLTPDELGRLRPEETEAFVQLSLLASPPPFIRKPELAHIRRRLSGFIGEKIAQSQKAAAPEDSASAVEFELELRTAYRKLATRLHPDRVGELTPTHSALWHDLQSAYAARDLEKIRRVEIRYLFHFERAKGGLSLDDLEKVHAQQKDELKALRADLRRARKNFDFGFADAQPTRRNEAAKLVRRELQYAKAELMDMLEAARFAVFELKFKAERKARKKPSRPRHFG